MHICSRRKRANGVLIKKSCLFCKLIGLVLLSIFMRILADLRCFFVILRCVAVGVRCEANSCFEEEMASMFGEEKSFDTHFCQRLVSISLYVTVLRLLRQYFNENIVSKSF